MEDTLVEERQAVMHPPCGGNPTLRKAHFLKPLLSEDHTLLPAPPSPTLCSKPISQTLKNYSFRSYKKYPSEKWKIWVHSLRPKYEKIWKQAGVYEAIMASTYKIPKDKDLIMGLAERWCPETNTFVFPWGEVTITLEDVMFLGGFSVLGALYLTPLADECVGIFDSLKEVHREIKLLCGKHVSCAMWMEYFMCSGKQLEHEAFLAMWLSRFVLLHSNENIVVCNFHVAIHLSGGNRIALAPVVLASIYMDMRLIHNSIIESIDLESKACSIFSLCHSDLVHMWAWERFSELRPTPSVMGRNELRSARWNGVKLLEVKDVRVALDSGKESFMWRPYVITPSNCLLSMLYKDSEQWLVVESDDVESYARCLRVSELVGLNNIEQYLPHRVAMQFGLDQDVPPHVIRSNKCPKTAWRSYSRSFKGTEIYVPPRLFESDVSSQYVVWWQGLLPVNEETLTTCNQNKKHFPLISWGHKRRHSRHSTLLTVPGSVSERPHNYVEKDSLTVAQAMSRSRKTSPRKIGSSRKINDLYDEPVLQIKFGTETPEKLICRTESIISSARSISSSTERPINLKEDPKEDAVVSKANCLEIDIINLEEETCANTDTLVEEREVIMCPSGGGNPTLRTAHFLKPIFSEHQNHLPSPPTSLFSSRSTSENLRKYKLCSKAYPTEKWKLWLHSLEPKYQQVWKQAGIYEAIMASTYKIPKNKDLIFGLAERWCAKTNTFIFPWGETTITLEDVMVLGGYSVLGALYLTPVADECIYETLRKAYKEVRTSWGNASAPMWMEYFMFSGKPFEHEAFLAMWLSTFVLIRNCGKIVVKDFHVAIHLSRGNRIALAPVVLASIYTEMRLLQNSIVGSSEVESKDHLRFILNHVDMVQMWVLERFPNLRPTPSVMEWTEPRSAQWNGVEILKVKDVRAALDSVKESFIWRPYVITPCNCMLSKLYRDSEQWIVVESDDIESFARCLRVSELVGLDNIEQYLPHRVAMQFGLDQDVPPPVMRSNECPKTAWRSYNRSYKGTKIYIPARLYESDYSSRYVVWWRDLLPMNEKIVTTCTQNEKYLSLISWGQKRRRSRKTLSRKGKRFDKGNGPDDMLISKPNFGTETPARRFGLTEPLILSVRSLSSFDNTMERNSAAKRSVSLKEDAVVNTTNHAEVNNSNIKISKEAVVSKANCLEDKIVNIKEESRNNCTVELPHLELMARILRLETIVDVVKAATLDASLVDIETVVLDRT